MAGGSACALVSACLWRDALCLAGQAHDTDVNVISWNRLVAYMMASGADDGTLRIWDLRSFTQVRCRGARRGRHCRALRCAGRWGAGRSVGGGRLITCVVVVWRTRVVGASRTGR